MAEERTSFDAHAADIAEQDPGEIEQVVRAFEHLPKLANDDKDLIRRGRYLAVEFLVGIGRVPFLVLVREGKIAALERGPFLMRSWRFAIRGSSQAWRRFWQPVPEPGWHDLFALTKRGAASIEGDLLPLMTHLQYLKDLLALPRRVASGV
jgi:hypothetical protein